MRGSRVAALHPTLALPSPRKGEGLRTATSDTTSPDVDQGDGESETQDSGDESTPGDSAEETATSTDTSTTDGDQPDGTPIPCDLTGQWHATFEGTDWGVVNVQFQQTGDTWEAIGNGVDTDEGPLTVELSGTVDGTEFFGEYVNDHHWEPGEIDYLGEVDGTCYEDLLLGNWRSCTYETVVDGECPAWMWQGRFQAVRDLGVEIHIEGCVASVEAMCVVAASCAEEFPRVPDVEVLETCGLVVTQHMDQIETACTEYLTNGVENGEFMAIYLNSASETHIESCMDYQNCDPAFLAEVLLAYQDFVASEDPSTLYALLAPLLAECYME